MANQKLGIGSRIEHPKFGLGVVCQLDGSYYKIYFASTDEVRSIDRSYDGIRVVEEVASGVPPIDLQEIEQAIENAFNKYAEHQGVVPIANKWIGGTLIVKAGSDDLQPKEIPIRTFFNKIIMVRDRLRVLEQNINSHDSLDEADKIHLQQYITRAYGSLTTFNVLFSEKEDQFKGVQK